MNASDGVRALAGITGVGEITLDMRAWVVERGGGGERRPSKGVCHDVAGVRTCLASDFWPTQLSCFG